jgi:hypothetical protein
VNMVMNLQVPWNVGDFSAWWAIMCFCVPLFNEHVWLWNVREPMSGEKNFSQYSAKATGWSTGVWFRQGQVLFLFATAFRPLLGPTQPPVERVPAAFSSRIKWQGREADHSPQCSVEINNAWSYTSTPSYIFRAWCLVKYRIRHHGVVLSQVQGQLYFTLLYFTSPLGSCLLPVPPHVTSWAPYVLQLWNTKCKISVIISAPGIQCSFPNMENRW